MKLLLFCLLLGALFCTGQSTNKRAQAFRTIPIPTKEHGYGNFESIVFRSQKELNAFLTNTPTDFGWNNRQAFEDALRNAKVNFSKEALVLLRHTESSGSVKVTFATPILKGRNLLCEIGGEPIPSGNMGTADMAYYGFALAVSKAHVKQVELRENQGGLSPNRLTPLVLPITEK
jgi:hypothetical protein